MTIKPIVTPTQKRISTTDAEKKDGHGGHTVSQVVVVEQPNLSQQNVGVRAGAAHASHRNVIDGHGQSPQRRELFDEISRHRRSPHKSTRNKRRDHHDHTNKRDRSERGLDKHCNTAVNSNKCSSPRPHAAVASVVAVGTNSGGGNSPGLGGVITSEQLTAIPSVLGCQSPNAQTAATQVAGNLIKAAEDTYAGYNSGDEHQQPKEALITVDEWQQRDEEFAKCMSENGYVLKAVEEDGACLFRAISLQIYGDEEMHDVIRQHTMDYIYKNREYFSHFVTEDINSYIKRKRRKDSHGNHIEIQAMSEIYSRPVEVYCYKPTPINIFNSEQLNNGYAPLRLSYQRGSHYNAIIDPYNATVGVGLGLAGYKPEMQTKEAVHLSEQFEIEQTMFEDKLKTTDWEATNEAIEEQIARESYLQWCRENLQKTRSSSAAATASSSSTSSSCCATSTSATVTSAEAASDSEASPSKYAMLRNGAGSGAVGGGIITSNSTITATVNNNGCASNNTSLIAASTSAAATSCSAMSALIGMSTKTFSFKHESANIIADADFESDDTDMSSTSSTAGNCNSGNNSPSTAPLAASSMRPKKSRNRSSVGAISGTGSVLRSIKKRRRDINVTTVNAHTMSAAKKDVQNVSISSPKRDASTTELKEALVAAAAAASTELEQQPSTSKQLLSPPAKEPKEETARSRQKQPLSSLYQELLEASYAAADGFEQLNESEMLQRAIQMSTHDYIEDQKRKYYFGS